MKKPWLTIATASIATEALMIAMAFLWVFIYSITISTGGDNAYYEAYAQTASPVVAVVVAFPVFYAMGVMMRRYGDVARFAALAVVGMNLALDIVVVATMAVDLPYNVVMSLIAATMKIAGAWLATPPPGADHTNYQATG